MPGNKYLLADKSKLLQKKLEKLTAALQGGLGNESLQTQEQYIFETIKALGEFYKDLNEPLLSKKTIEQIRIDDLPDPELYNTIWNQVLDDLTTLFTELENVEDLTVANFNFITTESNRLTSRLKAVDSKLGDYILYSLNSSKNTFFFKDSFNDLSKVDINSSLLNATQCDVGQAEGIVTLPVNKSGDSLVVVKASPIINPNSNGTVGNNQEVGAPFNGNLSVLLDNNPDTWFEYEKVVQATLDDKEPLTLDITMNLGEEKVVNHIRINPNNFGTKTIIQIEDIKTSIDGQVYTSIKDDIPIAGFTTQDEENIFNLAPSTSKFAGQGLYTFTPRKIKYIHFIFKQAEPYVITTPAGERLRYAIGIRDIDVRSWEYESIGEIISAPFESTAEIRKVFLESNQNPTEISELARIQYFVSPNDGGSWYEIQPYQFNGPTGVDAVPEILDFNTGDADQISTPVPVKAIRLKTLFTRNDDAFVEGSSSLNKRTVTKAEIHTVPQSAPFNLDLEQPPVDGTVSVVDPLFGSRGIPESQYILGHGTDRLDTRRFRLPFTNFPRPFKKVSDGASPIPTWHIEPVPASEWMHLEVGGEEWSHATAALSTYTLDFDNLQNFKLFVFNPTNGVLEFGDSLTTTLAPADNQPVSLYFDAERIFPSEDEHTAQLEFPTSSNKNDVTIKRYDLITSVTETFSRKAMVIRLEQKNIVATSDIASSLNAQGYDPSPKTFINGRDELTTITSWSIDTDEGIIYTGAPTSAIADITASYTYQPVETLSIDDWDWATQNLLRDSVSIKESAWSTIDVDNHPIPITSGTKVIDVQNMSLVEETLSFTLEVSGITVSTDDTNHPFVKEVDFINGTQELGGQFLVTTETIPNDLIPTANVASFDLKENISTLTSEHLTSFSNTTLFSTLVGAAGLVLTAGDYFVDRSIGVNYGKVYVYSATSPVPDTGTATYYYTSPTFADNGLYSVDYKLGRIHSQRPINPTNDVTYSLTTDYQYTDYRAEYRIARQLSLDSYKVDITNRTVTINDDEILKHIQIPHSSTSGRSQLYLINYDYVDQTREDIEDLKDKFSPVLKDYVLKIITKGRVV